MTFIQVGNTLQSDDGRYQIEKMRDHRGLTYNAWSTGLHEWDACWMFLGGFQDVSSAKRICEVVGDKNGRL